MTGEETETTVIIMTMEELDIVHQISWKNRINLILELKNHFKIEDKNLLALIVKTELVLQVYLAKVKRHKLAQINFALAVLREALFQKNQIIQKTLALEIVKAQPLVDFAAENNEQEQRT